jgi:hypothetical protein
VGLAPEVLVQESSALGRLGAVTYGSLLAVVVIIVPDSFWGWPERGETVSVSGESFQMAGCRQQHQHQQQHQQQHQTRT